MSLSECVFGRSNIIKIFERSRSKIHVVEPLGIPHLTLFVLEKRIVLSYLAAYYHRASIALYVPIARIGIMLKGFSLHLKPSFCILFMKIPSIEHRDCPYQQYDCLISPFDYRGPLYSSSLRLRSRTCARTGGAIHSRLRHSRSNHLQELAPCRQRPRFATCGTAELSC